MRPFYLRLILAATRRPLVPPNVPRPANRGTGSTVREPREIPSQSKSLGRGPRFLDRRTLFFVGSLPISGQVLCSKISDLRPNFRGPWPCGTRAWAMFLANICLQN